MGGIQLPKRPDRPQKYGKLPASPYAPLFIEKLLLAIIEARDLPHETFRVSNSAHLPSVRLARAMKALFGVSHKTEPNPDLAKLVAAAQENLWDESSRQHEIQMLGRKARETTVPFSKVVGLEDSTQTDDAERPTYVRLLRKYQNKSFFKYLYWITNIKEHQEELDMLTDLRTITEILERWNVGTKVDPERLGMYSLSHNWPSS